MNSAVGTFETFDDELAKQGSSHEPLIISRSSMATGENRVSQAVSACRIRVVSGLQCGASIDVASGETVSIGGLGADVRLRDPDAASAHVNLRVTATGLCIEHLAGTVRVDKQTLSPGDARNANAAMHLWLGDVALIAEPLHDDGAETNVQDSGAGVSPVTQPRSGQGPSAAAALADLPKSPINKRFAKSATMVFVLAAALAAATLLGRGSHQVAAPALTLEQLLDTPRFADLIVSEVNGQSYIDGVLPDSQTVSELDALLSANVMLAINRVETDASLAAKVLDVLRVNGADAELASSRAGEVHVMTNVASDQDLGALKAIVHRDVPALTSLVIENTPPIEVFSMQPGKRVAMVVSVAPAHVVTVDETRYFVGSVLPSGYQIDRIENNEVVVSRHGQSTVLRF